MALWKPDASFYPSPKMAMQAPPEKFGYVAALNVGRNDRPDAVAVVDLDTGLARWIHTGRRCGRRRRRRSLGRGRDGTYRPLVG